MSYILQETQKRDIVFHDDIPKFNQIYSDSPVNALWGVTYETKEKWKRELRPYDALWQVFLNIDIALDEIQSNIKDIKDNIAAVQENLRLQQKVLEEYITVQCKEKKQLDENLTSMIFTFEQTVKSNDELATQSEAQYLAVKRKLEELNIK